MRDWEAYVRTHLPPSALGQARESRIVRELASQIQDCYRDALARGLSDSEADAFASAQITDWTSFADTLAEADRPHRRSRIDRWSERFDDREPHVRPRMSGLGGIWQDSSPGRPLCGADSLAGAGVRRHGRHDHGTGHRTPGHGIHRLQRLSVQAGRPAQPARAVLAELGH